MLRRIIAQMRSRNRAKPAEPAQQLEPEAIISWSQRLRLELETIRSNSSDLQEKYKDVPLRARPRSAKKPETKSGGNPEAAGGAKKPANQAARSSAKAKPSQGKTGKPGGKRAN